MIDTTNFPTVQQANDAFMAAKPGGGDLTNAQIFGDSTKTPNPIVQSTAAPTAAPAPDTSTFNASANAGNAPAALNPSRPYTGSDGNTYDAANTDANGRPMLIGSSSTPTSNDRSSATSAFQSEIDALNQVYAQQKKQAAIEGQNALGSNTAIEARRGLLGSDFGAAATSKVNAANSDVQASIDAKHNVDVGAIYGKIGQAAQDAANARVNAAKAGVDASLAEIKGRPDAIKANVASAVTAYLNAGNDGSKLTTQNIKDWAKALNTTPDVVQNAISSVIQAKKVADDKAALDQKNALPASAQEYEYAKKNGYTGTYTQYQNEDSNRKAISSGQAGKFTSTQVNKGAANAGVSSSSFATLDPDVQNYFISKPAAEITAVNQEIKSVSDGSKSVQDVKDEIDSSKNTDAVKTYLKSLVDQNAPKAGGQSNFEWYNSATW